MPREVEEILEKIKSCRHLDSGHSAIKTLVHYLPYHHAAPFFGDRILYEEWRQFSADKESILYEIRQHMVTSWDAANTFRAMSCWRNLSKFNAWIWLLGDEDYFGDLTQLREYYGKSALTKICDYYNIDYSSWDDGVRLNTPKKAHNPPP